MRALTLGVIIPLTTNSAYDMLRDGTFLFMMTRVMAEETGAVTSALRAGGVVMINAAALFTWEFGMHGIDVCPINDVVLDDRTYRRAVIGESGTGIMVNLNERVGVVNIGVRQFGISVSPTFAKLHDSFLILLSNATYQNFVDNGYID
ncbi:hypothetical protein EV127DRAFT_430376 [Xylaria flabelliformis]|nr:hypothetical protein EV127DRAFT_430376 [Xylaria flabelliformis]